MQELAIDGIIPDKSNLIFIKITECTLMYSKYTLKTRKLIKKILKPEIISIYWKLAIERF